MNKNNLNRIKLIQILFLASGIINHTNKNDKIWPVFSSCDSVRVAENISNAFSNSELICDFLGYF